MNSIVVFSMFESVMFTVEISKQWYVLLVVLTERGVRFERDSDGPRISVFRMTLIFVIISLGVAVIDFNGVSLPPDGAAGGSDGGDVLHEPQSAEQEEQLSNEEQWLSPQ